MAVESRILTSANKRESKQQKDHPSKMKYRQLYHRGDSLVKMDFVHSEVQSDNAQKQQVNSARAYAPLLQVLVSDPKIPPVPPSGQAPTPIHQPVLPPYISPQPVIPPSPSLPPSVQPVPSQSQPTQQQLQNEYLSRFNLIRHQIQAVMATVMFNSGNYSHVLANRHTRSLEIKDIAVLQVNEETFTVQSSSNSATQYTVKKLTSVCKKSHCYVKCNEFPCINLCYHMFSCTCIDYAKHICKHIHRVHCIYSKSQSTSSNNTDQDCDEFANLPMDIPNNTTDHSRLTQDIRSILQTISDQLDNPIIQSQRLSTVKECLMGIKNANNATISLLDQSRIKPVKPIDNIAPGTLNTLQPRFRPTTNVPGKRKKPRLTAPSAEQKKELLKSPASTPTTPNLVDNPSQHVPGQRRFSHTGSTFWPHTHYVRNPHSISTLPTTMPQRNMFIRSTSSTLVSTPSAIGIPSGLLATPSSLNRPIEITLANGKKMKIIVGNKYAGACVPLGQPDPDIDA
ncbi:uncharacterized protein [Amphiura filiformis]|uniref:uncharacterized protein n=1 Tax=Amphiura filiformis TaxID=82378 RepID=UPI003B21E119